MKGLSNIDTAAGIERVDQLCHNRRPWLQTGDFLRELSNKQNGLVNYLTI